MTLTAWMLDQAWCGIHYAGDNPTITLAGYSAANNATTTAAISTSATSWTAYDGNGATVGSGSVAANATTITVATSGTWVGGSTVVPGYYTVTTGAGSNGNVTGIAMVCPGASAASHLYVPVSTGDSQINFAAWIGGALDRDYYQLFGYYVTCTTNSTSTLSWSSGLAFSTSMVNAYIMGSGIPAGTYVVSVNVGAQTLLMSNSASTSLTAFQVNFSCSTQYANFASPTTVAANIVTNYTTDKYFTGPQDSARPHTLWVSSNIQAYQPAGQAPDSAYWGAVATYLAAHGASGAQYELPTNEPENGVWSTSQIITYWKAAAAAVLAADSTAKPLGWCSNGIFNNSQLSDVATFLADAYINAHIAGFTNHMENSHQNMGNFVALRQLFDKLKATFTAASLPQLPLRLTETGIWGGLYGVRQPRREARQRTLLRLVVESYGWAKENCYDFPVWDHQGSGLAQYMVDQVAGGGGHGSPRAGAYACHVQSEALYGTTCTLASPPAKMNFGPAGSVGNSLFMGSYYTGTTRNVAVIATAGIESDTVTLNVGTTGAAAAAYAWDGWGNTRAVTVTGTQITVAVDDLLTYVFLPTGTAVTVVDTGSNVLTVFNSTPNLALTAGSLVNESSTSVAGVVNNGSFGENYSGVTGVLTPYVDATGSGSLTASNLTNGARNLTGVVIQSAGPAWQTVGASLTAFNLVATINGSNVTVYSYTQSKAVSAAIPGAVNANSTDLTPLTSWWQNPFTWVIPASKMSNLTGPITALKLNITGVSYGGQPDLNASTNAIIQTATFTSIVVSGTTVTVTVPNWFQVGSTITVAGVTGFTGSQPNGTFSVTSVSATGVTPQTFTYTFSGASGTGSGGTASTVLSQNSPQAIQLTEWQMYSSLPVAASSVQGVGVQGAFAQGYSGGALFAGSASATLSLSTTLAGSNIATGTAAQSISLSTSCVGAVLINNTASAALSLSTALAGSQITTVSIFSGYGVTLYGTAPSATVVNSINLTSAAYGTLPYGTSAASATSASFSVVAGGYGTMSYGTSSYKKRQTTTPSIATQGVTFSTSCVGLAAYVGTAFTTINLITSVTTASTSTGAVSQALTLGSSVTGAQLLAGGASASLQLSTSCIGSLVLTGLASSTITLSTSCVESPFLSGVLASTISFYATVVGRQIVNGTASATITLGSSLIGAPTHLGVALTTVTLGSNVVGSLIENAAASAMIALAPTLAGNPTLTGSASQTTALSTVCVGLLGVPGSCVAQITMTTQCVGRQVASGVASTTLSFASSVQGALIEVGAMTSSINIGASVVGSLIYIGAASTTIQLNTSTVGQSLAAVIGSVALNDEFLHSVTINDNTYETVTMSDFAVGTVAIGDHL